jgi:hypothetical protein
LRTFLYRIQNLHYQLYFLNYNTNKSIDIKINYDLRIKSISVYHNNIILLGLDRKNSNMKLHNSLITLYLKENNKLTLLDSIEIKKAQIDGSVIYMNDFF